MSLTAMPLPVMDTETYGEQQKRKTKNALNYQHREKNSNAYKQQTISWIQKCHIQQGT
jgi:hypothetical protein